MSVRLRKEWDALRASYSFAPTAMTLVALVLWIVLGELDSARHAAGAPPLPWLYRNSVEAARSFLFAVAGGLVAVIGVVFSITMIPLTIAASQLGPRLLRNFLRDTGTQLVLGAFVASFVFCMLVLARLGDDATASLPQLLVSTALLLSVVCLVALVYFINHIATSIQAPHVVAEVSAELHRAIEQTFPPRRAEPAHLDAPRALRQAQHLPRVEVLATASGYLQARDDAALLELADAHDLLVQLLREPGQFVVVGTPVARIWGAPPAAEELQGAVRAAFVLGEQRTLVQDIEFGINELVEVAVRALSPAINDPFTAITCLDWLGHALCQLCARQLPEASQADARGVVRLVSAPATFGKLLDAALNQIREQARGNTAVTRHLLATIGVVASCAATADERAALLRHVRLVEQGFPGGAAERAGQQEVAARAQQLVLLLDDGSSSGPGTADAAGRTGELPTTRGTIR